MEIKLGQLLYAGVKLGQLLHVGVMLGQFLHVEVKLGQLFLLCCASVRNQSIKSSLKTVTVEKRHYLFAVYQHPKQSRAVK